MKPNYKNWMPKGMIYAGAAGTGAFFALYLAVRLTGRISSGWRTALLAIGLAGFAVGAVSTTWMTLMYRTFSYDGKRQLSRRIIEEIAAHVSLAEGSEALDIACSNARLRASSGESSVAKSRSSTASGSFCQKTWLK